MKDAIKNLLKERYFAKGETTWEQLAKRVSAIYPKAHELIKEMKFIPSSPTLMNGNNPNSYAGLSSCFPLSIEDSMEAIGNAAKDCMLVTKGGGGVGYPFSNLRSSKEGIKGCQGALSSGPLAYERIFNTLLNEIQQGGRRRGAGMAAYDIDHPDIIEIIKSKEDPNNNAYIRFNHSIRVTNDFYHRLQNDPNAIMKVKFKDGTLHNLIDNKGNTVTHKQLWQLLMYHAWKTAEPGILNVDISTERNPCTNDRDQIGYNPCSEFSHIHNSSCNLGSMNLIKYVISSKPGYIFDWEEFAKDIRIATRYLDSVIDHNKFPTETIAKTTRAIRPVGLGLMGLHSAMVNLHIPYSSAEGVAFTKKIMQALTYFSMSESVELAKEKGAYEIYDEKMFFDANKRFFDNDSNAWKDHPIINDCGELRESIKQYGIRNSVVTSIAPTGSISFIADVSSGIEPFPFLMYTRKLEELSKDGKPTYKDIKVCIAEFEEIISGIKDEKFKKMIENHISTNNGSLQGFDIYGGDATKELCDLFQIAGDLSIEQHLNIMEQASFYSTTSVSKTINLKNSVTVDEVSDVYLNAWKRGIVGVTIYRDGCRDGVLQAKSEKKEDCDCTGALERDPKRPELIDAEMNFVVVKGTNYYVAVSMRDGYVWEIFTGVNVDETEEREGELYIPKIVKDGKIKRIKSGDYNFIDNIGTVYKLKNRHINPECELVSRLISKDFQRRIPITEIITQIEKTKTYSQDFVKAILKVLKKYVKDGTPVVGAKCEKCGSDLIRISGCKQCSSCGWAACS